MVLARVMLFVRGMVFLLLSGVLIKNILPSLHPTGWCIKWKGWREMLSPTTAVFQYFNKQLNCSQAFPTVIVFMIMFQWYIVGGICSLSAIYPSISPTALFASFLAVCVVISNVCYLSDNNCFHVPVLCVSPGRYNLKIHSVIEFRSTTIQFNSQF